jgi:hypothetical protein
MDTPTLRHLLATLAYRASKVLRDVPPEFATLSLGPASRRPVQILSHMADLMAWAVTLAREEHVWVAGGSDDWHRELQRFFTELRTLDDALTRTTPSDTAIKKLIQGPVADALTHVGQLALLRGVAGVAIRPESYAKADVEIGRVGLDQAPSRREFDGDASRVHIE